MHNNLSTPNTLWRRISDCLLQAASWYKMWGSAVYTCQAKPNFAPEGLFCLWRWQTYKHLLWQKLLPTVMRSLRAWFLTILSSSLFHLHTGTKSIHILTRVNWLLKESSDLLTLLYESAGICPESNDSWNQVRPTDPVGLSPELSLEPWWLTKQSQALLCQSLCITCTNS